MSDQGIDDERGIKALLTNTAHGSQNLKVQKPNGIKTSDRNGNDIPGDYKNSTKRYILLILLILVFILGLIDLILTIFVYDTLYLGYGMQSMEFIPQEQIVKFKGDIDFEYVYKRDGLLEGYSDIPFEIQSADGAVQFNLQNRQGRSDNKMTINSSGIFVRGVNSMDIVDPDTGEMLFSTIATDITLPNGAKNLQAKFLSTKCIASPIDDNLSFRSEASTMLRGSEGTRMESKSLTWTADQDIHLKSINGSVILSGKDGVFIDVKYLPIAKVVNDTGAVGQYKICVCMPQGKLFKVPMLGNRQVSCSNINLIGDLNPCL